MLWRKVVPKYVIKYVKYTSNWKLFLQYPFQCLVLGVIMVDKRWIYLMMLIYFTELYNCYINSIKHRKLLYFWVKIVLNATTIWLWYKGHVIYLLCWHTNKKTCNVMMITDKEIELYLSKWWAPCYPCIYLSRTENIGLLFPFTCACELWNVTESTWMSLLWAGRTDTGQSRDGMSPFLNMSLWQDSHVAGRVIATMLLPRSWNNQDLILCGDLNPVNAAETVSGSGYSG